MPLRLFFSYSHKDEQLRDQLAVQLAVLERLNLILPWHDRRIGAGDEWSHQIDEHLRTAEIVLLLISPDFLASSYCFDVEMKLALERHSAHRAIVIPIILRPCDWAGTPFAHLQALPRDARAITLWTNQDEAFAAVAKSIRETVLRFQQPPKPPQPSTLLDSTLVDPNKPQPRVLDAAMPAHIVKDRATELSVLIRLPTSRGLQGILEDDDEAEARPEDVRSKPFEVAFPLGPTGVPEPMPVSIELTAPDFVPPQQKKNVIIPINADSETCSFLLTPIRFGTLTVVIELVWRDATRGSRRLRVTCIAESDTATTGMRVVRMPVVVADQIGALRSVAAAVSAKPREATGVFESFSPTQAMAHPAQIDDQTSPYSAAPPPMVASANPQPKLSAPGSRPRSNVVVIVVILAAILIAGLIFFRR